MASIGTFAAFAAITAIAAVPALAHPKLVTSIPAANATVAAPAAINLNFNEKLVPRFTGATVTMTSMPGMAMDKLMVVASDPAYGADGKTVTLKPAKPLTPGAYRVEWHAVAADTHRTAGAFAFKVR